MPTTRFTWLNTEHVNLYSSLGAGLGLNGGSESDVDGKHTVAGFAANVELIGISADWGQWFAYSELGGSFSLRNKSTIFLAASRIISIGIGFRF